MLPYPNPKSAVAMEASVAAEAEGGRSSGGDQEPARRPSGSARRQVVQRSPRKQGELARAAAKEVVLGLKSIRAAAEAHSVRNHTLIQHYVRKWRGTEVEVALRSESIQESGSPTVPSATVPGETQEASATAALKPTPDERPSLTATAAASSTACVLPPIPNDLSTQRRHARQKWFVRVAAKLVTNGTHSYREALKEVNSFYQNSKYAVSVHYSMLQRYHCAGSEYNPSAPGKLSYLPVDFEDRLVSWIRAVRSLNFPVFKGAVIGVANEALNNTAYLAKFKAGRLGSSWYYRFLGRYSHILDTDSARPLELDRAKWATAANVGPWYNMVATELIKAGVAILNPDFCAAAPRGSPCAVQVHITQPDRIISFDETRVELDMSKTATKAKQLRTIIDKTVPRNRQRDTLAQQGGLAGTGVGGSTASGKALPGFFILSGKSIAQGWMKPSPLNGFCDKDGKMLESHFFANNKGGMEFDLGVKYFRDVILPCFSDLSEAKPLVAFCDGHGSHLTLDLIEFCRAHHIIVLLRVPHTSHLMQGEDLRNFQVFKSEFTAHKTARIAQNWRQEIYKLRSEDFMEMVAPAWNVAFTQENCAAGWRDSGLYPFTRKVFFDLAEAEAAARARCAEHAHAEIDYEKLSFAAIYEGRLNTGSDDNEGEDVEESLTKKSRLSSADLHRLGPVTATTAYNIIKRRTEERNAAEAERVERREAKKQRIVNEHAAAVQLVDKLHLTSMADVKELNVNELKALLRVKAAARWNENKKLKGKPALTVAVKALLPDLPERGDGEQHGRARGRGAGRGAGGRGRGRGRGRGGASTSARSDGAPEHCESPESDAAAESESEFDSSAEYAVESLMDACKDGELFRYRVRWEDYGSDEDSWEPEEMLKDSASELLSSFLKARKDAGEWPPILSWEDMQD